MGAGRDGEARPLMGVCQACGGPLPPRKRAAGRATKWCSQRCRRRQYEGVCKHCGKPTSGASGPGKAPEVCRSCNSAIEKPGPTARTAAARPRRLLIQEMWRAGASAKAIAAALGTTEATVSCEIVRMRRSGWDMPYRREGMARRYAA